MVRLFGHYISRHFLLLGLLELLLFFFALIAAYFVRFPSADIHSVLTENQLLPIAAMYAALMLMAMVAMGAYQKGLQDRAGLVVRMGLASLFVLMAMSLIFYAFPLFSLGRSIFGLTLLFSFAAVLILRWVFFRLAGVESLKHRLLVLGTGRNARLLQDLETPDAGFVIVNFVPLGDKIEAVPKARQAKLQDSLLSMAFMKGVDEIVVALDDRRKRLPVDDIIDCKMSSIRVFNLLSFYEKETARVNIDLLYPSWILFSDGFHMGAFAQHGKRLLDIMASLLLLPFAIPLMLLVSLCSLVESHGRDPVFFRQTRTGQNGKPFSVYKFRSMRTDAEADGVARWATENDTRVTSFGRFIRKTRMDELPQLFNVLRGNMSLVGPRPERPEFVAELAKEIPYYRERHRVKPGITGWAQLCYPYGATTEDAKRKLEYDLYYAKNASLFLDLIILLQTAEVVLWGKGAR